MHPPHHFLPVLNTSPPSADGLQPRNNPIIRGREVASRSGTLAQHHIDGIDKHRIRVVVVARCRFWLAILVRV